MAKKILSVGFVFPGGICECVPLTAKTSLLDADVVVFRPSVQPFITNYGFDWFQGKRSLNDHWSFELNAAASHWRQQLRMAVDAGRTVFVFLPALEEVFIDTGQRTYSGTGRNQRTTRQLASSSNYEMLPTFADKVVRADGKQMKLTDKAKFLASYWSKFGGDSAYKVMFDGLHGGALVKTATGDVPVGCTFTFKEAKGRVIALPPITDYDLEPEEFENAKWEDEHKAYGHQLADELLALDAAFRSEGSVTPPPKWTSADEFVFARERELNAALSETNVAIEAALAKKAELSEKVAKEGSLRRLLYEQGHPLEASIIEALTILGFKAEPFKEGGSEFDAVFSSAEGRFIGEAEGKDNKAINIDKLRQLEMNIQEELAREEVKEPAKGVLFGNAFRLHPLSERQDQYFTEKCLSAVQRTQTALVRTPDLFAAAKYARETGGDNYAARCRRAILEQGGRVVTFPSRPEAAKKEATAEKR